MLCLSSESFITWVSGHDKKNRNNMFFVFFLNCSCWVGGSITNQ
nr:MAG TPA: hypothetical protein [Caudoviricetes sp.]DAL57768.1 MAG TPA_asm: hypothetical protein [Bacteriophage sp.]